MCSLFWLCSYVEQVALEGLTLLCSVNSSHGQRCWCHQPLWYCLSAGGSHTRGICACMLVFWHLTFWLEATMWVSFLCWGSWGSGRVAEAVGGDWVAVLALVEHSPEGLLCSWVTASNITCKKNSLERHAWWAESFLAQRNIHNYPPSMSKYIVLCNLVHSLTFTKHYNFFLKVLGTIFFLCRIIYVAFSRDSLQSPLAFDFAGRL